MPAVRLSRRRRSSLAISFNPAKAGYYGINSPSPRPVTFAPNVTPVSYVEPDSESTSSTPEPNSPTSKLFPPSEMAQPAPSRRRVPPGKRRSMGYIPRPPNAFMLFRADFVRQKHVPGSIETNHGSLSKIIGNCWRSLPLEEKRVWEVKAKHAKAEHKQRYPEYRFRPVHNKNKEKKKEKPATTVEDERRCEDVAQLLLEGKKGDELAAAVRSLDSMRAVPPTHHHPVPSYSYQQQHKHRRSSSVPLPNDWHPHIALPSLPFLSLSPRSTSPVGHISRSNRLMLGSRRPSSARPAMMSRSWTMPTPSALQRDDSPLPEVDTSLFEQSFLDATSGFSFPKTHSDGTPFTFNDILSSLPGPAHNETPLGPLETIAPHNMTYAAALDPQSWLPHQSQSHTSSAYSGSPAPSDNSLPLHAPQPYHAHANPMPAVGMWHEFTSAFPEQQQQRLEQVQAVDFGLQSMPEYAESHPQHLLDYSPFDQGLGPCLGGGGDYRASAGLESLFEPSFCGQGQDVNLGFEFSEMIS